MRVTRCVDACVTYARLRRLLCRRRRRQWKPNENCYNVEIFAGAGARQRQGNKTHDTDNDDDDKGKDRAQLKAD